MTSANLTPEATNTTLSEDGNGDAGHRIRAGVLLALGAAAGPVYLALGFSQVVLRDGFDPARHAFSLLSNGPFGWVQILNFLLTGVFVIFGAAGLRRALQVSPSDVKGAVWVGRLLTAYGVSLLAAGVFRADPALGFPPGTPDGTDEISWHGMLHLMAGGIGFGCFIAACFVVARLSSRHERRTWAWFSRLTGVLFLAAFVGIASGSAGPTTLAFVAAVVLSWIWVSSLCRKVARDARPRLQGTER